MCALIFCFFFKKKNTILLIFVQLDAVVRGCDRIVPVDVYGTTILIENKITYNNDNFKSSWLSTDCRRFDIWRTDAYEEDSTRTKFDSMVSTLNERTNKIKYDFLGFVDNFARCQRRR